MAVKFTKGDSMRSTRQISRVNNAKRVEPHTRSDGSLERGNTMSGMPGYIDAHPHTYIDGAKGGKGAGPHREGLIGRKGESERFKATAYGTVAKDAIHGEHKGYSGAVKSNKSDGTHHLHTANKTHGMTHPQASPTAHGKIPGGGKSAGIGHSRGAQFGTGVGHAGRMEKLSGQARTRFEGRRKTSMY